MKTTEFKGVRVEVETSSSFDEVTERLVRATGQATLPDVIALAGEAKSGDEYDRIVNDKYAKQSGFMRFAEVNHGAWLSVYGIRRRTVRWIIGNPTLAVTMLRHDLNAGLFVPIELLLTEQPEGRGTSVLYVRPSSLIALDSASAELRAAVRVLDEKMSALVDEITATGKPPVMPHSPRP
jgi:uncharacterized protein (DUF302 family)